MTRAFAAETTIDRPTEAVWARLTDWDAAREWMSGVDALHAQGPTTAGTTLVFTAAGKERTAEISSLLEGRSITLRSSRCGVTADYRYDCAPAGDGTRVSLEADVSFCGPVRLFGPVIRRAVRKADGGQLDTFAATFPTA